MAGARRLLGRLGARLAYGRPVRVGDRAVIPVARVRLVGGFGFGTQEGPDGEEGGGGGGILLSRPVGFIDAGPEGARFEPIDDRARRARLLLAGAGAGALAATAVAGTTAGALVARRLVRTAAGSRRLVRRRRRVRPLPWPR